MVAPLDEFSKRIKQQLSLGERPSSLTVTPAEYMTQMGGRRHHFRLLAAQLLSQTIQPRVAKLAEHLPNAKLVNANGGMVCTCWFGYSQQCPANIKLVFTLHHDERIEELILSYELRMVPAFMWYDRYDRFAMPVQGLDKGRLDAWVEDKLIGFLHACQRLDRIGHKQNDVLVTDPVCGMRSNRSAAAAHMDYKGHAYYFCTKDCRREFAADPGHFAVFELERARW